MIAIQVVITRYLNDDPQPGIVECILEDAYGHHWVFIEKTAVVNAEYLDSQTIYPQPGMIACTIIEERYDETGRMILLINTNHPWGIEANDGTTTFEVVPDTLIRWDS